MKISVLGAGSWGTALAVLLCGNKHEVTLWSIDEREVRMIREHREQQEKLPGVPIPEEITVTNDLEAGVVGHDMLVLAVPSIFIRSTAKGIAKYVTPEQILVNVSKGIEEATLMNMTDVIEDEIPHGKIGVLSGPSHAEEVGRGIPTTVVVGAKDRETAETIQDAFMNSYFRVYTSPDMIGIELGAALKNVIALAAGVVDGLGYGDNTKAALITRGIAEITRLGTAMGGRVETFGGLSGIGDLIVTCTSTHSRNHNAGYLIGQGKTYQEAMKEVNMVVEGVYSAKAALALANKYHVEVPITEQVNRVLFDGVPAKEAVLQLLMRNRTSESVWEI